MQATYHGQVTQREYTRALELHYNQLNWAKWACGIILAVLIFSLAITIVRQPAVTQALFPGLLFPLVILTSPWWAIALQASAYKQKGNIYHTPISGLINDYEVTVSTASSRSTILWAAYTSYKKKDGIVLLYQGRNSFNIFTKSMFKNEADWSQFVAFLEARFKQARK